jgi:hypothetical protein
MHANHSLTNRLIRGSQHLLALLFVAFVWLQFAGTLHKYVHAPVVMHQAAVEGSQSLDALFPEHTKQSGSDCQLLDLQCFGVALSQAMPTLALPVFALQTAWHKTAVFDTRTRVVYLARAPPALI